MTSFNLFDSDSRGKIERITSALHSLDLTYVSYCLLTPDGKRLHFHTNQDWCDIILEHNLMKDCVVNRFCMQTNKPSMIVWDNAMIGNKHEKEVMLARHDLGILNGLTITDFFHGYQDIISFGTGSQSHDAFKIYQKAKLVIRESIIDCRESALQTMILR